MRAEIVRAKGREVCFLAEVAPDGALTQIRAVARGNRTAVLAAAREATPGSVMIHNHPSGLIEPSDADLEVAAQLYEEGIGSAIISPDGSELYVVVEPPRVRPIVPLDLEALGDLIAPSGPLSAAHKGYEDRPSQREMIRLVGERYNEGGILLVEAGTGTGKSLAYLLPAAVWARENGQRTVISTNTINLQEQLVSKDLPLAQKLLGGTLRWALAKGRGNYISIRRAELASAASTALFADDRTRELTAIGEWISTTEDGSLSSLGFEPTREVWEEVRSDSDACLRAQCPHFQQCFYQQSRRQAAAADLLVVNHHLLFADLSVRQAAGNYRDAAVLPAYDHLVIDEAHHIEDSATTHLGVELSRVGLTRLFSRMDRSGKGLLPALESLVDGGDAEGDDAEILDRVRTRVRPRVDEARDATHALMDALAVWMKGAGQGPRRLGGEDGDDPVASGEMAEPFDRAYSALGSLRSELGELCARIQLREDLSIELEGRLLDLQALVRRTDTVRSSLSTVLNPTSSERDQFVRWLVLRRGERRVPNLVLSASPVDVGESLRDALWERLRTVVLTSATLATEAGFGFVRERIGLHEGGGKEPVEALLATPFDFAKQSLFCIPTDLPPAQGGGDAFQEATASFIEHVAGSSGGGMFALFTSYRALEAVAALLRARGLDRRFPLFVHGEADRGHLLRDFVRAGDGVLLGTASFWEGVDVPGQPLRALVIQKLPFLSPNDPVTAARLEALAAQGRDPFWNLLVPHAALRLKQGFGRLIRSRDDRGIVVLLDDRIVTRKYGRPLLASLPPAPVVVDRAEGLARRISEFYADP